MKSFENSNEYSQTADRLQKLELEESAGKGIVYVHWIVEDLRKGDIGAAKANYRNQSDKYGAYPKIKAYLKEIGIVEEIDWSKLNGTD